MLDPEILFLDEPFAGVNPVPARPDHRAGAQAARGGPHLRHRRSRHRGVAAPGPPHGGDVARRKIADGTVAEVREDQEVLRAYAGV